MATFVDSQIIYSAQIFFLLGEVKFVGIGFLLSLVFLWIFVQSLVWLAERYSRLISNTDWWRSGTVAVVGMVVGILSWQLPGHFSEEETVDVVSAMTSSLIIGFFFAWFLCGKLYVFEFLHRVIVAVGVPLLVFCAIALGKVMEWKIKGQ